jgi:hypothetical protein
MNANTRRWLTKNCAIRLVLRASARMAKHDPNLRSSVSICGLKTDRIRGHPRLSSEALAKEDPSAVKSNP